MHRPYGTPNSILFVLPTPRRGAKERCAYGAALSVAILRFMVGILSLGRTSALAFVLFVAGGAVARAQAGADRISLGAEAEKITSPPLEYPAIARAARVEGTVHLRLMIRPDGSLQSAEVLDGPTMLTEAALENAKRSQYTCPYCRSSVPYEIAYTFKFLMTEPPKDCNETQPSPPPSTFDASSHQVTAFALEQWTCDPAATYWRVRSAKCLYLWRCGKRAEAN